MESLIIVRVRSREGQFRLSVNPKDTYGQLLLEISKKVNTAIKNLIVHNEKSKPISIDQSVKLKNIPYFTDGAILNVETSQLKESTITNIPPLEKNQQSKCSHSPGAKCLNCIQIGDQSKTQKKVQQKPKCNHGPTSKCLNCVEVNLKDKKGVSRMLCQHGLNAKCVHCLDQQFISDVAHVSFDNYLQQKKLKCKGVHSAEVKCNSCLPPSNIRYQVDLTCKNHEAYNKCVPPNVVIKRQEYRHVDYVQFMNIGQIQDLIRYWLP